MSEQILFDMAELFKMLGDSTRVRILNLLETESKTVSDIALELNLLQSTVSHQLRLLKLYKVVKSTKKGKYVVYEFMDKHISELFTICKAHLLEG
jgi:ArsR family transcriptional regulator